MEQPGRYHVCNRSERHAIERDRLGGGNLRVHTGCRYSAQRGQRSNLARGIHADRHNQLQHGFERCRDQRRGASHVVRFRRYVARSRRHVTGFRHRVTGFRHHANATGGLEPNDAGDYVEYYSSAYRLWHGAWRSPVECHSFGARGVRVHAACRYDAAGRQSSAPAYGVHTGGFSPLQQGIQGRVH